jgi:heat shock protein HtpX
LPTPKIYIIDSPALNAFATGRDPQHAVVAVTTGILQRLEKPELEGVLAHELSHVGNYDIRLLMVVTALAGVVMIMTDVFWRWRFSTEAVGEEGEGMGEFS